MPKPDLRKPEPRQSDQGAISFWTELCDPVRVKSSKIWRSGICALIFIGVALLFSNSLRNGFVAYDDDLYVTGNSAVQQGLSRRTLTWAWTSTDASNWHPITWLSHALDCQLYGLSPLGHHLTSVLLHAFSSVLVFVVFSRLTGAIWRSLLLALFFGFHPLRVESVAWVAERKDVLSVFFCMLTLWAYVHYVENSEFSAAPKTFWPFNRKNKLWYFVALLFFSLGLLSKPMLVTLPFLLLLLDYWPLARWPRIKMVRLALEKLPFLGLSAAASVITFLVQKSGGAMFETVPFLARLQNGLISYVRYLGKLFWPENLAHFYPFPQSSSFEVTLLAVLFLVVVTFLAFRLGRKYPYFPVGWFWFLGTLIPVLGFVQVGHQAMADRYTYLPSLGALLVLVWGIVDLIGQHKSGPYILVASSIALLSCCAGLTWRQIRFWHDSKSLFNHQLAIYPGDYEARNKLADALVQEGSLDEAAREYELVLKVRPAYLQARNNLGITLDRLGRHADAIDEFEEGLKIGPDNADLHNHLGAALSRAGHLQEAIAQFRAALEVNTNDQEALNNMGMLSARIGNFDDAIRHFDRLVKLDPQNATAWNNLGFTFLSEKRPDLAVEPFNKALAINPNYMEAHNNLGLALLTQGMAKEASAQFQCYGKAAGSYLVICHSA